MDEITFERSVDYSLIRELITHPSVFPHVTDDFSAPPDKYKPIESDLIWYVLARQEGDPIALWILVPLNTICWDVHTVVLPSAYGPVAAKAAKECITWVWKHTRCLRLVTSIPEDNRLAVRFAKQAGFTHFGTNPKSYMKNNTLHNLLLYGVSKSWQ